MHKTGCTQHPHSVLTQRLRLFSTDNCCCDLSNMTYSNIRLHLLAYFGTLIWFPTISQLLASQRTGCDCVTHKRKTSRVPGLWKFQWDAQTTYAVCLDSFTFFPYLSFWQHCSATVDRWLPTQNDQHSHQLSDMSVSIARVWRLSLRTWQAVICGTGDNCVLQHSPPDQCGHLQCRASLCTGLLHCTVHCHRQLDNIQQPQVWG